MRTKEERKAKKVAKKQRIKQLPIYKKIIRYVLIAIIFFVILIIMLASVGTVAHAAGLVDETINTSNEYSKYGLSNYQLDFYVNNDWGWLPWNWSDGIGKSVSYGLYAITNFVWIISLYLSNATGYLVQEAYSLDFISKTVDSIGKNIQTIAGVTKAGFSTSGFYVGFLLILIFVLGIYVTYTGLIKRETTKAVRAVINFVVVFILSASFIAYAPDYIGKINDFSKDISTSALDVGTKIVMPDTNSKGKNSVDMIRDSLFSVQVKQPWLLLQYGTTDVDSLGADRVESLLSTSPDTNNGEDREDIVITEIETFNNANLSISKTVSRLGTVFFLFIFNIGISVFVFLLTGMMIFSQVLFIIFAMFLPISFLLSMIPSFDGMGRKAIMKLFNVIMTRAGLTLIITVAFSISTMLYSLAGSSPFFMIMFLQIVTFAGIYFKLGDIMNMFALQSNDSQGMGRQMFRKPRMFLNRQSRRLQRNVSRAIGKSSRSGKEKEAPAPTKTTKANHERQNENGNESTANRSTSTKQNPDNRSAGTRAGEKMGDLMEAKNRMVDKAGDMKDTIKSVPTNAKYAVHKGKRDLVRNVSEFSQSVADTRNQQQQERATKRNEKKATVAQRRQEMDKAKAEKSNLEPNASMQKRQRAYEERKQPVPRTAPTPQASATKTTPERTGTATNQQYERPLQKQKNIPKEQVKSSKRENTSTTSKNSKTENKTTKTTTKRRKQ